MVPQPSTPQTGHAHDAWHIHQRTVRPGQAKRHQRIRQKLLSADEVMANILHMTQNMSEDVIALGMPAPNTPAPPTYVSCDSCLLHKATAAPRNTIAFAKPSRPLLNMSS
jgi:hypothetical protein